MTQNLLQINVYSYSGVLLQGWYHYEKLTDLLGDGIFSVDGEKWLHQRKVASYEIGTKIVRDFSLEVFKSNAVKLAGVVSKTAMSNNAVDYQVRFVEVHYK